MALTKCNVPKDVIGSLGTNPSERGLTTQQFKDKFDEMPEGIIDYLNNTLTEELDPVVGKVATLSNKNILHNWDFRNPVNQRGQSSYSATTVAHCIDRWLAQNADVTIVSGGVKVETTGYDSFMVQVIENPSLYAGETLTFSAAVKDVVDGVYLKAYGFDGSNYTVSTSQVVTTAGIVSCTITLPSTLAQLFVRLCVADNTGAAVFVKAKLENGAISTLAYDPPADYGEELRKCQRYYVAFGGNDANEKFGVGVYLSSTQFLLTIPLKVEMRANPTVTATGNFVLLPGGTAITGVSITNDGSTAKTGSLLVQGFSGKTAGQSARLEANNDLNARIVFSAEL